MEVLKAKEYGCEAINKQSNAPLIVTGLKLRLKDSNTEIFLDEKDITELKDFSTWIIESLEEESPIYKLVVKKYLN